ncbi:MAG: hypothetical protein EP335_03940 [Alphaproteobacteria bacterium]|nr:MAG: hypothetical protein EP335_03940 [Alphaproteobacteria bacterium]
MMRLRTLVAAGVLAFLVSFIAFMPASVALSIAGPRGLAYASATGSLWQMTLSDAAIAGVPLGTLQIEPSAVAFLTGGMDADISFSGGDFSGRLTVADAEAGYALTDVRLVMDSDGRIGRLPLLGAVAINSDRIVLTDQGGCADGSVRLRSDMLARSFGNMGGEAPILAGPVRCDGGAFVYGLEGGNRVAVLKAGGRWQPGQPLVLDVVVTTDKGTPVPSDLQSALEFAGLRAEPDGWRGQLSLDSF